MKVILDTSVLCLLLNPNSNVTTHPDTGRPIDQARERVEYLFQALDKSKAKIVIPTPVVSEIMVCMNPSAWDSVLAKIRSSKVFEPAGFDERAAVELALLHRDLDPALKEDAKPNNETKAKVIFDRQIIAIGIVSNARTIYAGDKRLGKLAKRRGLDVVMTWDLPYPPVEPQTTLQFEE